MSEKQKYVIGFIFNKELDKILLLKKNKSPVGLEGKMTGKLNTPGGKMEHGEVPEYAIYREILEETGLSIFPNRWKKFCELDTKFGFVYCYYTVTDEIFDFKQIEDEELGIYNIHGRDYDESYLTDYYKNYERMANLDYLIPMALNHAQKLDSCEVFEIKEIYK